jgi:polyhydroxyalkanoate depolymerase
LYRNYEVARLLTAPVHASATLQTRVLRALPGPAPVGVALRSWRALAETLATLRLTHDRPQFGIDSIAIDGEVLPVHEEVVRSTPFGMLVRFAKPVVDQPKVLVVPALAGHFGTLVRETVRTLLADHEVYVADWCNARDVPLAAGPFGLDDYIAHVIDFLDATGPGTHLIAVCQPCPAALAAAAVMAEDDHPAQPWSIVLMAGPVDTCVNPGRVNRFAADVSLEALERRVITTVPWPRGGAGRRVYPGFLQAAAFMSLDPGRHVTAIGELMFDIATGNDVDAERTRAFYDEYFAVLDIPAELYLETVRAVFMDHDLPRGRLEWRGRRVDPSAVASALLTIEGENDELCPPGQTRAAHELCRGIPAARKHHHQQAGVGHYGVFSGSRFRHEIYPRIKSFIQDAEHRGAVLP